jgi:hypothetical protein
MEADGAMIMTVPSEDDRATGDVVYALYLQTTLHRNPAAGSLVLYQGAYPHLQEEGEAAPVAHCTPTL